MSDTNLNWFLFFWVLFTGVNVYITVYKPEHEYRVQLQKAKEPIRQNDVMYAKVLVKIKSPECSSTTDKENNTFYTCKDGTSVSMINWTRGTDRKGVVTRSYDSAGKVELIYGHPDDVY